MAADATAPLTPCQDAFAAQAHLVNEETLFCHLPEVAVGDSLGLGHCTEAKHLESILLLIQAVAWGWQPSPERWQQPPAWDRMRTVRVKSYSYSQTTGFLHDVLIHLVARSRVSFARKNKLFLWGKLFVRSKQCSFLYERLVNAHIDLGLFHASHIQIKQLTNSSRFKQLAHCEDLTGAFQKKWVSIWRVKSSQNLEMHVLEKTTEYLLSLHFGVSG